MKDIFDIEDGKLCYYSGKEQEVVTVPDGVREIAEYAFVANETITEVILPQGLIEIGESAFASCKNLKKITLPDSLELIAEEAFYSCTSLSEITIPQSLTQIGESAFAYCEALRKIDIPGNVKIVGKGAFESCSEITELTLGEGIEKIERDAFSDCVKIAELKFPSSLTEIGRSAFCACNIKEVDIQDGIKSIGRDAFHNCERLQSVRIGKGVTEIGDAAFGYCANLTKIEVAKGNEYFTVKGNCLIDVKNKKLLQATPDFEIPTDGSVTVFADSSFGGMKNIKSFEVPAFIEKIGAYVFSDCDRLRRLTVHRNNKHYVAQNDCIIELSTGTLIAGCSPRDIPTDGKVKIIADGAFTPNAELTSLYIPDGVTKLKDFAFSSFPSLCTVRLPDSLISIESNAFMDCAKLKDVTFGKNIENISSWVFAGCESLTEIEFPESLRFIGENAFYHVPLVSAKFRAPKNWVVKDFHQAEKKAKLKNPQKAAKALTEKNCVRTFERTSK